MLLHERNHLQRRDPLLISLVTLISKSIFFVPGISCLTNIFLTETELAADDKATNHFQETQLLSSALIKMVAWQRQLCLGEKSSAVARFSSIVETRIDRLLNRSVQLQPKYFFLRIIFSALVVGGIFLTSFYANQLVAASTELSYFTNQESMALCPMLENWEDYLYANCSAESAVGINCLSDSGNHTC